MHSNQTTMVDDYNTPYIKEGLFYVFLQKFPRMLPNLEINWTNMD